MKQEFNSISKLIFIVIYCASCFKNLVKFIDLYEPKKIKQLGTRQNRVQLFFDSEISSRQKISALWNWKNIQKNLILVKTRVHAITCYRTYSWWKIILLVCFSLVTGIRSISLMSPSLAQMTLKINLTAAKWTEVVIRTSACTARIRNAPTFPFGKPTSYISNFLKANCKFSR